MKIKMTDENNGNASNNGNAINDSNDDLQSPQIQTTPLAVQNTSTVTIVGNTGNQADSIMKIDATKVKIPEFLPENVDLWFWQVESAFTAANIRADAKKYHTIIGQLPSTVIVKLADCRTNPPPRGEMYTKLKEKIVKEYADSAEKNITKLLEDMPIGDRKPSQLLAEMRSRAANTPINDELFCHFWMRNLPDTIRAILSTDNSSSLTTKATMADKIYDAMRTTFGGLSRTVNEVQSNKTQTRNVNFNQPTAAAAESAPKDLVSIVASLANEVKQLRMSQRRPRSKTPCPSSSSHQSKNASENSSQDTSTKREFDYCWWHFKHGAQAQKCKQPCKWSQSNNSGN